MCSVWTTLAESNLSNKKTLAESTLNLFFLGGEKKACAKESM